MVFVALAARDRHQQRQHAHDSVDAAVADALDAIRKGDNVRIDGWLIKASATDGWRWRSSTTRDDTGGGACEVIYACSISKQ